MEILKTAYYLDNGSSNTVNIAQPDLCPICKKHIEGKVLYVVIDRNNEEYYGFVFCPACKEVFISTHDKFGDVICCEPNKFVEKTFPNELSEISPQFIKIYNQAYAAECSELDEIAGIGYRKALEFLVKDFCISEHSDDSEKIKSMFLSQCITQYIDNVQIRELAQKCAWLGNDETHYIKKHNDRDLSDLKKFIEALIYFISMHLIYTESKGITSA